MVETRVFESGNSMEMLNTRRKAKDCSIPEMISFLQTAYRPMDFEEVERKLMLREQRLKIDKEALEDKVKHAMKREVELEEELKDCRTRCRELEETRRNVDERNRALSIELERVKKERISLGEKLGGLEFDKYAIEDELKKYKRLYDQLKEKFICLQEDYKIVCERGKTTRERNSTLSEELKKMEDDTREKYVQLKVENRNLECGKKRAENEIETWKNMLVESESRVLNLEEDTLVLKLEAEPRGLLNVISHEDKEKKGASFATNIQEEANSASDGACYKRLNCDAGSNMPVDMGSSCPSPDEGSINVQVTGPPCICIPHKHLVKVEEEKDKVSVKTELQDRTRVRRLFEFEQEGSSDQKMAGSKPAIGRPMVAIEIDSDDETSEMKIISVATSNIRDKGKTPVSVDNSLKGFLKDEKEMAPENCLKRIHSSQRGEKHKSICNITSSDSEGDNDEDKIPVRKRKMKKLLDLTHESMGFPVNQCSTASILYSGDGKFKKSFAPSKWPLLPLGQCEERKGGLERISPGHLGRNGSDTDCQIMVGLAAENAQDHKRGDVGSGTKAADSLYGFMVDGSDCSGREDTSTDRRNRKNKSEWTFEADMLSSFQKDPELCMKAVCALYRQQTFEEKSIKGSLYLNNQGFNKFDAISSRRLLRSWRSTCWEDSMNAEGWLSNTPSICSRFTRTKRTLTFRDHLSVKAWMKETLHTCYGCA
ncbi:uncharacterized protein LOC122081950 isoform X2 [Macadamia integrifolia]|uniref:uncharacterized protein LOC122081950 isoform X2 n=1 Tax=Macadamia integrifolia TaxID=60698 RepID=UPI001C4E6FD7|nr:uncharacterized protein LOC122081950 isoform X2 [Macadamia integrifolia]